MAPIIGRARRWLRWTSLKNILYLFTTTFIFINVINFLWMWNEASKKPYYGSVEEMIRNKGT